MAELNARVHAQTLKQVINFGVFCLLVGGSICAVVPIVQRRQSRRPLSEKSVSATD